MSNEQQTRPPKGTVAIRSGGDGEWVRLSQWAHFRVQTGDGDMDYVDVSLDADGRVLVLAGHKLNLEPQAQNCVSVWVSDDWKRVRE